MLSPRRRVAAREESWQSLHHSEDSADNDEDGYSDVSMGEAADDEGEEQPAEGPMFPTVNDVRRALHPLQATADRLGKQVENFATTLDRLSNKRQKIDHPDCRYTLPHVREYQKIANETVVQLRKSLSPEKRRSLAKQSQQDARWSVPHSESGPAQDDTLYDLRRWEEEEQTWDLLGSMLQVQFPVPQKDRSALKPFFKNSPNLVRPLQKHELHRYSSENEVWNNYLASDDQAWEQHTVLEWLKRCADKSGQEIDEMVEELESEADRGSGLTAPSWLYTKEAIKGQKRLRSWPKALEPDGPGLDTSLVNASRMEPLVTQLDPDAISRQGRHLEKEDQLFERAIWLACWEMLRRGKDWNFIHSWLQEKGELWRSTVMRSNLEMLMSLDTDWQSRSLWRKTCAIAAREGENDSYETAFYGFLSGYLPSVVKISRGWDDYLLAHYNAFLLASFEEYTRIHFPERYPSALAANTGSFDFSVCGGQLPESGIEIIESMKVHPDTTQEAMGPLKMLQGSLIAKTFDQYVFTHGVRLSRAANAFIESKILTAMPLSLLEGTSRTARITPQDYDLLRVLTHMIFVFQDMGLDHPKGPRLFAIESIIVAYVDFLSKAGKQQMLPLYASRLSRERCITCLARQLPLVIETSERQTMMKLMKKYHIDISAVLAMQLQLIIEESPAESNPKGPFPALQILEPGNSAELAPGQIKAHFIGDDITDEQYDLIHGLEWFMLLEGHWKISMIVGATIYKYFLRTGALAAARLLSRNVTFSNFSLCKTQAILGYVTDIRRDYDLGDHEGASQIAPQKQGPKRSRKQQATSTIPPERIKNEREILLDQSKSFRDLESLFVALDAIEIWKDLAIEAQK